MGNFVFRDAYRVVGGVVRFEDDEQDGAGMAGGEESFRSLWAKPDRLLAQDFDLVQKVLKTITETASKRLRE